MTPRSAAERGPRTAAGRALLDSMRGKYRPGTLGWLGADTWIPTILAIEAEAAAAPLDVERLRQAMWEQEPHTCDDNFGNCALIIAAEYARLAAPQGGAGEAEPE